MFHLLKDLIMVSCLSDVAGSEYQCESGAGDCKENGLPIAEAGPIWGDNEGEGLGGHW